MNVAVWRWHERVWDVTTNDQDQVSALMNFGTRPKMPDDAPNFGYTNVETANNAVTGAIVAAETSAQGEHILANVAGAWTLTRDADQFICVEQSKALET